MPAGALLPGRARHARVDVAAQAKLLYCAHSRAVSVRSSARLARCRAALCVRARKGWALLHVCVTDAVRYYMRCSKYRNFDLESSTSHSSLHSFITLLLHSLLITLVGALHSHYTRTGECNRGVMVLHHITGVTPGVTLSVVLVCGRVSVRLAVTAPV